jgi:hypothetical protein
MDWTPIETVNLIRVIVINITALLEEVEKEYGEIIFMLI